MVRIISYPPVKKPEIEHVAFCRCGAQLGYRKDDIRDHLLSVDGYGTDIKKTVRGITCPNCYYILYDWRIQTIDKSPPLCYNPFVREEGEL